MSSESANFIIVFDTSQYERLINTVLKKGCLSFSRHTKTWFSCDSIFAVFWAYSGKKILGPTTNWVTIRRNSEIPSLNFFCYRYPPCLLQFWPNFWRRCIIFGKYYGFLQTLLPSMECDISWNPVTFGKWYLHSQGYISWFDFFATSKVYAPSSTIEIFLSNSFKCLACCFSDTTFRAAARCEVRKFFTSFCMKYMLWRTIWAKVDDVILKISS